VIAAWCQPVRLGAYQAAATALPELPMSWWPTITYPAWPAATATAVPVPSPAVPLVTVHVRASAEDASSGLPFPASVVPTASQPAGPCTTPANCPVPALVSDAGPRSAARVQSVPPFVEDHSPGPPFTPPAATSVASDAPIAVRITRDVPAVPVKLVPASRAGGKPAASADGACPPVPPPPVTTTIATPTAIAARIGAASPMTQFRLRMMSSTPLLAAR